MDISVIIVSYNTSELLGKCVDALNKAKGTLSLQVIIVDNASQDGSRALLENKFSDCDLIFNEVNVGFGRANNQALPLLQGRYVLLLNTDAFISSDTLDKTINYMESSPNCGVLGVKLVGRDGELQPSCRYFPYPISVFMSRSGLARFFSGIKLVDDLSWDHDSVRKCDWVPGCYYLIRREVVDQIGLFDPRYFLYYEEVDHCRAVKNAGWDVVYFPDTMVIHLGGESAKSEGELTPGSQQIEALQIESELLYFRKNHGFMAVCVGAILTSLADIIQVIKKLLKCKRPIGFANYYKHIALVWRLLILTRFGSYPTR
ncbi:MAG: glycosyltransferase [Candidatus Sedimenticola sp. (ex Thyasira tokunagai)]